MADQTTTAITKAAPTAGAAIRAYQPQSFGELMSMAELLSRSGLVPDALRGKAADVATIIMHGASLGIDAMASIRAIHCVKGKPVLSSDLTVALCLRHADVCESFRVVESTDEIATYEAKRRGQDAVRLSFSLEQARKAGLAGGDNWRKYPAAMLRARCGAATARAVFPDLVAGLYDPDELATEPPPREIDVSPSTLTPPEPAPTTTPAVLIEAVRTTPVDEPLSVPTAAPAEAAPVAPVTPPEDVVAKWTAAIDAATTVREIDAVGAKIKAAGLAGAGRDQVATRYANRKRELLNGGAR